MPEEIRTTNRTLLRLSEERDTQLAVADQLVSTVEERGGDLSQVEQDTLTRARERIVELDGQISQLAELEQVRQTHHRVMPGSSTQNVQDGGQRLGVAPRAVEYPTAGHFIVDLIRSQHHYGPQGQEVRADADAAQRVAAARAGTGIQQRAAGDVAPGVHQTTSDVPGLLPVKIIGDVMDQLDGLRPFLTSIGIKPLAGIPGKVFHRPQITQHTQVDRQAAEKAELASRELVIGSVPFEKYTFGGWLNVSRQAIDWTDPGAWNIIVNDLQAEYAEETDADTAGIFAAGVTQTAATIPAADRLKVEAWVSALYAAAVMTATKDGTATARVRRLPDTIYTSMDMWATLGTVLDVSAIKDPGFRAGQGMPTGFAGSILTFPRVMVPSLPAGTVVVGRNSGFEFYEERIGLLSAVVPRVLGVEVAYGGYAASGFLDPTLFAKVAVGA